MEYFKLAFIPVEYGEKALTVIVPFNSEKDMKKFYNNDASSIIDYSVSCEEEYNEWLATEANKKKYQKINSQH